MATPLTKRDPMSGGMVETKYARLVRSELNRARAQGDQQEVEMYEAALAEATS